MNMVKMEGVTISETYHGKDFIGVFALVDDGKLKVVEQEISDDAREYSRDGEIESWVYFTAPNTAKLMNVMEVRGEDELLECLQKHFGKFGSEAKREICNFCDMKGIAYDTDVYY